MAGATVKKQKFSSKKALELYRNALNSNVISRYDPAIKQLLYCTSHSVVYKFNEDTDEWVKSDYQGALALYLRHFSLPATGNGQPPTFEDLQNLFCYGLILLNRNNPDCFSMGLLPNRATKHYFPQGVIGNVLQMDVELNDNLIIIKNLLGEIYGLWIYNKEDRLKFYRLIEFCLTNNSDVL